MLFLHTSQHLTFPKQRCDLMIVVLNYLKKITGKLLFILIIMGNFVTNGLVISLLLASSISSPFICQEKYLFIFFIVF